MTTIQFPSTHDRADRRALINKLLLLKKTVRHMAQVRQGQTMAHDLVEAGA